MPTTQIKTKSTTPLNATRFQAAFILSFVVLLLFVGVTPGDAQAQSRPAQRTARPLLKSQPLPALTLQQMVSIAARESGISEHLLWAVVQQESSGRPGAVSPKGARGLAQLMPFTAKRFGVKNIHDPMENLRGGAKYLRYLLDYFNGDVKLALAGYNAGEGAVNKYGRRIPPYAETVNYVARIYPRFVASASSGGRPAIQSSSTRMAAMTRPRPIVVGAQVALAEQLPAGKDVPAQAKSPARSTGASVYFWQTQTRVSANLLPKQ